MEEKYRSGEIHVEDVLSFTEQLLETADILTEHMLNPDRILLSPQLIFIEEKNVRFCYLLWKTTALWKGWESFSQNDGVFCKPTGL